MSGRHHGASKPSACRSDTPCYHPGLMALVTGTRLGPYEIVAPLGAGGMGEVYRARDTRLGREVAVKVLPPDVASDPERLRRFEQESRAAGMLNHPGILSIYDIGLHDDAPYVVFELLEGETLQRLMSDAPDRKSTRLNSSHLKLSRMPSSA